jgi:hemoglobin-like flavoprotein
MRADALQPAFRDVLSEAVSDEVLSAWAETRWSLAEMLIGKQAALYDEVRSN